MTEEEAKNMYADMMIGFAEEGPEKVSSMILRLGRTDMHVLCSYLFIRSLDSDMQLHKFKTETNFWVSAKEGEDCDW